MRNVTTYQAVLGRLIVRKRQEKQMDQEALARRVGVSRSTWSRIEAGSSALNMDQLAKAADALDIPLGTLMTEVDETVRELQELDVEVSIGRVGLGSTKSLAGGAVGGAVGAVALLSGAVLGGVMAAVLANKDRENKAENDE